MAGHGPVAYAGVGGDDVGPPAGGENGQVEGHGHDDGQVALGGDGAGGGGVGFGRDEAAGVDEESGGGGGPGRGEDEPVVGGHGYLVVGGQGGQCFGQGGVAVAAADDVAAKGQNGPQRNEQQQPEPAFGGAHEFYL